MLFFRRSFHPSFMLSASFSPVAVYYSPFADRCPRSPWESSLRYWQCNQGANGRFSRRLLPYPIKRDRHIHSPVDTADQPESRLRLSDISFPASTTRIIFCAGFLLFLFGDSAWFYFRSRRPVSTSSRMISFGIIWFFVTLSIESSLVPIVDVIFEHGSICPRLGHLFLSPWVHRMIYRKWNSKIWTWALILIMATFSVATYKRNMIWRDDLILWSDNVKKSPGKGRPHYNLGNSYYLRGMTYEAIQEFQKAIQMNSVYADAYLNLGVAYASIGEEEKAMAALQKAIQFKPADSESHYNLGLLYSNKGLGPLAIEQYKKSAIAESCIRKCS